MYIKHHKTIQVIQATGGHRSPQVAPSPPWWSWTDHVLDMEQTTSSAWTVRSVSDEGSPEICPRGILSSELAEKNLSMERKKSESLQKNISQHWSTLQILLICLPPLQEIWEQINRRCSVDHSLGSHISDFGWHRYGNRALLGSWPYSAAPNSVVIGSPGAIEASNQRSIIDAMDISHS